MEFLLDGIRAVTPQQCVMYVVGALLIYLAIKKDYEPSLLLPMGFGAILVNLPMSGVLNQMVAGVGESQGIIQWLFETTIEASEALPLLLFIGIGAMIDFGPLLSNPKMFLFGAAAQFGIFFAMIAAVMLGFDLKDAASIGIIGAADGPTAILFHRSYTLIISALSRSPPTRTWRSCRSSSRSPSSWSRRKRTARCTCPTTPSMSPARCASASPSWSRSSRASSAVLSWPVCCPNRNRTPWRWSRHYRNQVRTTNVPPFVVPPSLTNVHSQ